MIQGVVAHISDKAKPGFYSVKAICKKATVTANFEVAPPRTPTSVKPAQGRQVSKIPVGARQTGGGGTVR